MTEQEIIEFWTNKINVEIPQKINAYIKKEEKEIIARNKVSKFKTDISLAQIVPLDMLRETHIPVCDYEILHRNNANLTGTWSCVSGSAAYEHNRKLTFPNASSYAVAPGTPIKGYYKVICINDNDVHCYYNYDNADEFVSQEVRINKYQLFALGSEGNRTIINEGDIIHVESLQLMNNHYTVKWHIL